MISFAGLASRVVSFLSFAVWVWLSQKHKEQNTKQKKTNNKKSTCKHKVSRLQNLSGKCWTPSFPFSPWLMLGAESQSLSQSVSPASGSGKWEKCSRVKGGGALGGQGGEGQRERETRRGKRGGWEVERKCDLVWVFWAACSICPPSWSGRVTSIGRNWISRLNIPPPLPSHHHHLPPPTLRLSTHSLLPLMAAGRLRGGDALAKSRPKEPCVTAEIDWVIRHPAVDY